MHALCQQVILNGDAEARYAGNLNLSFAYVEVRVTCSYRLFFHPAACIYIHTQCTSCPCAIFAVLQACLQYMFVRHLHDCRLYAFA
jgi:hypothetical protein